MFRGVKFTIDKKYVILDNNYIFSVLRRKIRSLRKEYD